MYDNNNYNNFNGTSGGEPPVNNQNENQGFNDNQNYNNNQGFNPDYSVGSNNQSYGNDPYGDSESYRERHSFFENGQQNVAPNYNETVNSYEWGTALNNGQNNPRNFNHKKVKKEKKPVTRSTVAIALVACFLIASVFGVGGGVGTYYLLANKNSTTTGLNVTKNSSTGGTESTNGTALSTKDITSKVADSVVEIVTESVSYSFYGQAVSQGAGSGVIIDKDGYIVTNHHVIENAKSIKVTLKNGNEYTAKLIGSDSDKDVALLKIEPKSDDNLTVAVFGDSDKLSVGDKAVAIGNPLGELGGTVTDGIISALDREVTIDNNSMNLLQTNAAINPGNSGGGLFDGQGNLIGIVVAKASSGSSNESVEGLGFAIPINDVESILNDLKKYGYVKGKPGAIGVVMQDYMDMVYVYSVTENSQADKAGLQKGDKIMSINGEKVSSSADVKKIVTNSKAGDKLKFVVERNGSQKTLTVTIKEASKSETNSNSSNSSNNSSDNSSDIYGNGGNDSYNDSYGSDNSSNGSNEDSVWNYFN